MEFVEIKKAVLLLCFFLLAELSVGVNLAVNHVDIVAFPEAVSGDVPEVFLVAAARGVAWFAHIGGFIAGLILVNKFQKRKVSFNW